MEGSPKSRLCSRCKAVYCKRTYCPPCSAAYQREYKQGIRRPRKEWAEAVCPYCEKVFKATARELKSRINASKSGKIYCSHSCRSLGWQQGKKGNIHSFKRRPGWDDERWHWEKLLVEAGLGMGRGETDYIQYTLDDPRRPRV